MHFAGDDEAYRLTSLQRNHVLADNTPTYTDNETASWPTIRLPIQITKPWLGRQYAYLYRVLLVREGRWVRYGQLSLLQQNTYLLTLITYLLILRSPQIRQAGLKLHQFGSDPFSIQQSARLYIRTSRACSVIIMN